MPDILTDVYAHNIIAVCRVDVIKLITHLAFSTECFNDAKSDKRLVNYTHGVTP